MPRISFGAPERPCPACKAQGYKWYGSTATWRGGIGGQAMTQGVCDTCWGSGDLDYPGYNIREAEAKVAQRVESLAFDHLERRMGQGLQLGVGIGELCAELDRYAKKRKATRDFVNLAEILAATLRGMATGKKCSPPVP